MIAGDIVGITYLKDRVRFTVEEKDRESTVEVYPTHCAMMVAVGWFVWTQSGTAYASGISENRKVSDINLYMIREDWNGYVWTLEEAMHGKVIKT